jgi:dolichol kinase
MRRIGKEEINRKLLHILALGCPVFIFYGPEWFSLSKEQAMWTVFAFLLLSLVIDLSRLYMVGFRAWFFNLFGSMMRTQEETQLTGATYIMAGSFICSWISLSSDAFAASAFISLSLFVLGDAAAALCGKAFGRVKVGDKTLEGAVGCFLLCFLLTFLFPYFPSFLSKWGGDFTWMHIILFPLGIALLELFPIKLGRLTLNDNLYIPAVISLLVLIK